MKQKIGNGSILDVATASEVAELVKGIQKANTDRTIRASATIQLDGTGSGTDEIYKVPLGMKFIVRRVSFNLSTATDPSTGSVALNVAGKYVAYTRSDLFIEYAVPIAPTALAQVPGVQTWSAYEGPLLQNGEVFGVKAVGLTVNSSLDVFIQGLLVDNQ